MNHAEDNWIRDEKLGTRRSGETPARAATSEQQTWGLI